MERDILNSFWNSFLVSYVTLKPGSTIKIMYQQVLYYHIQIA